MPLASKLIHYFNHRGVSYQPLHHSKSSALEEAIAHVQAVPELCVRSKILVDKRGAVQVVFPYLAEVDINLINKTLNRQFQEVADSQASKLFKDCEPSSQPAFGMAYGLPVIVDVELLDLDHVFVSCGCTTTLLRIERSDFDNAMKGAIKARMARWPEQASKPAIGSGLNACSGSISLDMAAKRLQSVYSLPPMPDTAVRILHLLSDPEADIDELSKIIEIDPSLSAQIMRYARSALFAYLGELASIKEAINRVLGFDRVSKLAMGIAASKAFNIPNEGPLGVKAFWQHALYSGAVCQAIAEECSDSIDPGQAYLAGLLHNFGILLIGHLFPPEFKMLNKLRSGDAEASMRDIEQHVFGIGAAQEFISLGHGTIGGILLKMWDMPEVVVKVAASHQNPDYSGACSEYVQVVQLANALLSEQEIGDENTVDFAAKLFDQLGLNEDKVRSKIDLVIEKCGSLSSVVLGMAS